MKFQLKKFPLLRGSTGCACAGPGVSVRVHQRLVRDSPSQRQTHGGWRLIRAFARASNEEEDRKVSRSGGLEGEREGWRQIPGERGGGLAGGRVYGARSSVTVISAFSDRAPCFGRAAAADSNIRISEYEIEIGF